MNNKIDLQFGFTEGLNPIMASLLISEAKCEKIKNSKGINVGIMDVQSAFDVVQHKILLDKLIDQSIHPTLCESSLIQSNCRSLRNLKS
jgi:hypothetical protein